MKKLLLVVLAAAAVYGACDLVREIRGAYTTGYSKVYAHAAGMVMSPAFDSLALSGRNIRIGVLDAGFGGMRTDRWTKGLHIAAWKDFTGGDSTAFFSDGEDHGTKVCSRIGGFSGDTVRGLAYDAEFYLAKTDLACEEPRSEEQNMIRGIEWLLAQGVQIISSSLSYSDFEDFHGYTAAMLDGRTSVVSRYLDSLLAARSELVFVQSAGNEGDKPWKYIAFPADVRDVITVGASDFEGRTRFHSSSTGRPEAGYVKPDFALEASPMGTSFSTPVITGLCACLLEYEPMSRDALIALLHASGTNAAAPDTEIGYGIPQTGTLLDLMDER